LKKKKQALTKNYYTLQLRNYTLPGGGGGDGRMDAGDGRITISFFNRRVYRAQRNGLVREVFCFY